MGPTLNLAAFQSRRGKMSISLMPSIIATPKTGIRLGFIAKTQSRRWKSSVGLSSTPAYQNSSSSWTTDCQRTSKICPSAIKTQSFFANGLTGVDFVRCWVSWSVLPLSRRPGLMCEYTGSLKDPQRHIDIHLTEAEVTKSVKKMLDEPVAVCSKVGRSPFCASNKPPAVRIASFLS